MIERYYLKADHEREWSSVTRKQFIAAERAAGFRSKFGPDHPATSGFSGKGMRGRVDYVTEYDDDLQLQEDALLTTLANCNEAERKRVTSDAPAAPERGEWRVQVAGANVYILDRNDNAIANLRNEYIAREIVKRYEQHSTLIAQRERLLRLLRAQSHHQRLVIAP